MFPDKQKIVNFFVNGYPTIRLCHIALFNKEARTIGGVLKEWNDQLKHQYCREDSPIVDGKSVDENTKLI